MEEIIEILNKISGEYSATEIFKDWVKMIAIAISNNSEFAGSVIWKDRERQFNEIKRKYSEDKFKLMKDAFNILVDCYCKEIDDYLGKIYMQCMMGNKITGQFFTPFHLAYLTAKLEELKENENGKYCVYEPTVGSGGMVLAYAKTLKENNINYQSKLQVEAQDLDYTAVHMAYIQFSLLGISAKVSQGDTLAEPVVTDKNRIFYTPKYKGILI